MQKIKDLLVRFRDLKIPNEEIRNKISVVVEEVSGIKLDIKSITVKDKVAYVSAGAMIKSEIFMNKKKIIEGLNGEIVNIR